jgi:hypothetical protein
MKSGTAIGILVGGAVLLLATAPRRAAAPGQGTIYPNPGGAINPLNWFGGAGSGALMQPGNIFGQQQSASPAFPYQGNGAPALTQNNGLLQPSYGNYGSGGNFIPVNYNTGSAAYSPAGSGYGADEYAAGYSPYPVPGAGGGAAYDYFPVMTPWGGFQDYSQLAANSQAAGVQVAGGSSPYNYSYA